MSVSPLDGISVLILVTDLTLGGANKAMETLAVSLADLGARCQVWALCGGGVLAEELARAGIESHVLGVSKHTLSWRSTNSVAELLRREKPTVVHSHNYEPNFHASAARRRASVPWLFITQHDARLRVHRVLANRWLRREVDQMVAVSRGLAELYRRRCGYKPEQVFVLPNAVDTDVFRPQPRSEAVLEELGLDDAEPVIGAVGGFAPHKGQDVLLRAFALLLRHKPKARLVLVGGGKHLLQAQDLAQRLGISDHVVFTGPREDVVQILSALDFFVQPSRQETDGIAVKEAMAAGKAVVSTATMGPAGYLRQGETGLLTPVGDWVRLAEALLQLADDPALRERLGAAARRQAEEEFSLPAYRQRLLELYSLTTKG